MKKYAVIISVIFLIIFFIIIFINRPAQLVTVQYGSLKDSFSTKALIVRDEKVIKSPWEGSAYPLQKEGKRITGGQKVTKIVENNGNENILYSREAGIISYAKDGLEDNLTPESLSKFGVDEFDSISRNYDYLTKGKELKSNSAAYRLINNNNLFLVIKSSTKETKRYNINEKVFIQRKQENNSLIEGKIVRKSSSNNGKSLLIIKLDQFVNNWLSNRWSEIEFIKNIHKGLIIPEQAIIEYNDELWVISKNFQDRDEVKNVDIIFKNNNEAIVNGLNAGDRVIINPDVEKIKKEVDNNEN
ncbi:MAG: HlyD family efflux transporter periplasmic adaptor subunit [Bacillota bacterium]